VECGRDGIVLFAICGDNVGGKVNGSREKDIFSRPFRVYFSESGREV
jgi:hypothetical protein